MRYLIRFADNEEVEVNSQSAGEARAIAHEEAIRRTPQARSEADQWQQRRIVECRPLKKSEGEQ